MRKLAIAVSILFVFSIWLLCEWEEQKQDNNRLQAQIAQQIPTQPRTIIEEPYTVIHSEDNYVYLNRLEIDTDKLDHATKYVDINGVTWLEVEQDGYITVYVKGHIEPEQVHWYAPYQ